MNFLKLIIFPSKTLDQLNQKKPDFLTLYLIWLFSGAGLVLPNFISSAIITPEKSERLILAIAIFPFLYVPITYFTGYLFWIVAKGFKGIASFTEMRILIVYSAVPFIFQFIISIPFIAIGIIKNDAGIISHDNNLSHLILWLLSFRILMVGIAKYNKFNWTITIFVWLIVATFLGGMAYLRTFLK
jgi:hypothetical protein